MLRHAVDTPLWHTAASICQDVHAAPTQCNDNRVQVPSSTMCHRFPEATCTHLLPRCAAQTSAHMYMLMLQGRPQNTVKTTTHVSNLANSEATHHIQGHRLSRSTNIAAVETVGGQTVGDSSTLMTRKLRTAVCSIMPWVASCPLTAS